MPGTDGDNSTRPISPISPTGALKLVLSSDPNHSIHDAAKDLTEWTHRNKCRLWCNGNLLPPDYITTSLVVVARTEGDDRPRADVVSSTREAWVQQTYNFELDADEVRACLPHQEPRQGREPPPEESHPEELDPQKLTLLPEEPQFEAPKKRRPEEVKEWLAEKMQNDPPKPGETKNAWARRQYPEMEMDFGEDIPWKDWECLRRRMNDP